jgi:hypothetical protein
MGWLVGIICLILVVVFWRVFLPFAGLAALALGGYLIYDNNQSNKLERERMRSEEALKAKLAGASSNSGGIQREWVVQTMRDPASGESKPRFASILSDGDLCTLQVEQRIDKKQLAGIYCPGFKINSYDDVEVKFDNLPTSDSMKLEKFSDGSDVYIPSYQQTYRNHLQYDEFLRRVTSAKKVALNVKFDVAGRHWITFSLNGAGSTLMAIGAVQPTPLAPPKASLPKNIVGDKGSQSKVTESKQTGARRTDANAGVPRLPTHAELDYTGNNWKCQRGYRKVENECRAVLLPMHAELDYTGNNWKCSRGHSRIGDECAPVGVPAHGELDYTGNNWKCQRGYSRTGGGCTTVQVPPNGELDYTGNSWKCQRGFRQAGAECVPVGIISAN